MDTEKVRKAWYTDILPLLETLAFIAQADNTDADVIEKAMAFDELMSE